MSSKVNCKLSGIFKIFFSLAAIASQSCSPGETYNSSKNLLMQSEGSVGAGDSVNQTLGTASCTFGNTILPHGQSATGYNALTVSNETTCGSHSLSVKCNNGVLSNLEYKYDTCTMLPPTNTAADSCAATPVSVEINASQSYQRVATGAYQNIAIPAINYAYNPNMLVAGGSFIIKLTGFYG